MSSDQPDSASPTLRRLGMWQRVARIVWIATGGIAIVSPLIVGLSVAAGAPEFLWRLPGIFLIVAFLGVVAWVGASLRDRRFRALRAAREDLAAEREQRS